jgi:hypothetical protein
LPAAPGLLVACRRPLPAGDFADRGPEWVFKGAGVAVPSDNDAGLGEWGKGEVVVLAM